MSLTASIIINTYNRASTLGNTLNSLGYLDYPDFEVIVVNGPSTDGTDRLLAGFKGIKTGSCPLPNLSMSRNIGICMAEGDIVAFIDDDAVPEPEWLSRIVAGYDSEIIGGVGGPVYNHTGYDLQAKFIVCNRFGDPRFEYSQNPTPYFNFPLSNEYCAMIGTNASFRRDVLLRAGGFDEEYDYFLDETDVCVRVVDAGYVIKFVDDAFVHHKFAPSHIRDNKKIVLRWHPIVKNKVYFSLKNSALTHTEGERLDNISAFMKNISQGVEDALECGAMTKEQYGQFQRDLVAGLGQGFLDGRTKERELIEAGDLARYRAPYLRFETKDPGEKLMVCFLSQDFPPEHNGGIGRFTHDLAKGIAGLGHQVHVITAGKDHNTVDMEDGVWVHRIVRRHHEDKSMLPSGLSVPDSIWDHSYSFYEEVKRIAAFRRIDIVEAPIWDVEGLACVLDRGLSTVVNLETTYAIALHSHKEWEKNPEYKKNFVDKVIEAEKFVYNNATALHAISRAIVSSIEKESDVRLPEEKIGLVPLGVMDRSAHYGNRRDDKEVRILFVGRLEERKGIDVLLKCVPGVCGRHPDVRFVIVGDDRIKNENGNLYKDEFLRTHAGSGFLDRVEFKGKVSEDDLYRHYSECDIFVAPSRYESFGLIFLEAMQFGKPVVGCRAGGMVEIIEDGVNGRLAEPGDAGSLETAIESLVVDEPLRKKTGAMSRRIFEERYTVEKMAENTINFYKGLLREKSSS